MDNSQRPNLGKRWQAFREIETLCHRHPERKKTRPIQVRKRKTARIPGLDCMQAVELLGCVLPLTAVEDEPVNDVPKR
jgi:hypothetical protein